MKPNSERRESAWLTPRELADALDVSVDYLRSELLRRVPRDLLRRDGNRIRVYGRGVIEHLFGQLNDGVTDATDHAIDDQLIDELFGS